MIPQLTFRHTQALQTADYDVVLMDLNYARDTTSGKEGLDLLKQIQILDSMLPGNRHDGLGKRRARRGSHAARGPRFRPEAMGQHATADNPPYAARVGQSLAQGRAARGGAARLQREQERPRMIASSAVMQPVLDLISRIGPSDAKQSLHGGRTRTGRKSWLARFTPSASQLQAACYRQRRGLSEGVVSKASFSAT